MDVIFPMFIGRQHSEDTLKIVLPSVIIGTTVLVIVVVTCATLMVILGRRKRKDNKR